MSQLRMLVIYTPAALLEFRSVHENQVAFIRTMKREAFDGWAVVPFSGEFEAELFRRGVDQMFEHVRDTLTSDASLSPVMVPYTGE